MTLKQRLCQEYNFMLFRCRGTRLLLGHSNRVIPSELKEVFNEYEKARLALLKSLQLTHNRRKYYSHNGVKL